MTFSAKGFKNREVIKKLVFKAAVFVIAFLLLMFKPGSALSANADTLVIMDSGAIDLIVGDGVSTVTNDAESQTLGLEAKAKEVNLVPERTESVVKVEPSKTDSKKVQVTVTQVSKQTAPAPSQARGEKQTKTGNAPPPIVKEVDQVVAQGKSGNVVLSVNPAGKDSNGKGQVSINQGATSATTSLPVQINSVKHSVSVVSPQGTQENLSVLPKEAVYDVVSKGLIDAGVPAVRTFETSALLVAEQSQGKTKPAAQPSQSGKQAPPETSVKILQNEPVYEISGNKTINLLNVVNFKIPVNVQMSAKTGEVRSFVINIPKLLGF